MGRWQLSALAGVALVVGCDDGNGTDCDACTGDTGGICETGSDCAVTGPAYDLEGFWLLEQSIGTNPMTGEEVVVTRDTTPSSLVGDATFTLVDATHGTWALRPFLLMNQGLTVFDDTAFRYPIPWEVELVGDQWTQRSAPLEISYTWVLDGDTLSLNGDIILSRSTPFDARTVGQWTFVRLSHPRIGTDLTPETCHPVPDQPMLWFIVQHDLDMYEDHAFLISEGYTYYDDDACTLAAADLPIGVLGDASTWGYSEERGDNLRIYTGSRADMAIALAGDQLTLTRTACAPAPDCEGYNWTELVLAPR